MPEQHVKPQSGGGGQNDAARRHLEYLFKPFIDAGVHGLFCVGHSNPSDTSMNGRPAWFADLFTLTVDGIQRALDYAARNNSVSGVYVRPGVIRPDYRGNPNAITDSDIIALNALWIDCDEDDHFNVIDAWEPGCGWPPPTFDVVTGTQPSLRRQSWWILDRPETDLEAWHRTSIGLQTFMGSDSAVANPSRYMRLAGFTSYPKPKYPNRVVELVTPQRGSGVAHSFARLKDTWERYGPQATSNVHSDPTAFGHDAASWAGVDMGVARGRDDKALIDLLEQGKRDGAWHNAALRVVASLVGRGDTDAGIHAWFLAYGRADHGLGDHEIQGLIDGAVAKYGRDRLRRMPRVDETTEALLPIGARALGDCIDELESPSYIVDDIFQRGWLYTVTAPPGAGKTAIAVNLAACVATGAAFAGHETVQGRVLYLAGENDEDVVRRFLVACERRNLVPAEVDVVMIRRRFDIQTDMTQLAAECSAFGDIAMVIVDTSAAYFCGDNENDNAQMIAWAGTLRRLCGEIPGRPTTLALAHPKMNQASDYMVPRGGGGFLGEIDGNIGVHKEADTLVFKTCPVKFRGAPFGDIAFEIVEMQSDHPKMVDTKGRKIRVAYAEPINEYREAEIKSEANADDDAMLIDMLRVQDLSQRDRARSLRWDGAGLDAARMRVRRSVGRLKKHGLVFIGRKGEAALTDAGRREAKRLDEGVSKREDEAF
jgi:hypothetical protein